MLTRLAFSTIFKTPITEKLACVHSVFSRSVDDGSINESKKATLSMNTSASVNYQ